MSILKYFKWFLVSMSMVLLVGCGSGDNNSDVASTEPDSSLNSNVVVVDSNNSTDIVITSSFEDENTNLSVSEELAASLKIEDIFYLPSDANSNYPFGISGKIESIQGRNIELSMVNYADIVKQSELEETVTELTSDNFIGVIAPSSVSPSTVAKQSQKIVGKSNSKSYLDGGVVFIDNRGQGQAKSFLGEDGSISLGNIEFNLEVDLASIADVTPLSDPINTHTEPKIIISGSLNNLKLYESHNIDILGQDVELSVKAEGELSTELKIQGAMTATVGSFDQAWREVEEDTYEAFGSSVALSGLDSRDKYGKYPLIGLMFKSPTPVKVNTQTGIQLVKSGGIILWLYINAKGEITADGETGVGINAKFMVGIDKQKDEGLNFIKNVTNIPNKRLLETPFIDGTLAQRATIGVSFDLDTFAFGIRMASVGLDMIGEQSVELTSDGGRASYGVDTLGGEWSWSGTSVCVEGSLGAGVLVTGDIGLGIDIDAGIFDANANFLYSYQFPTQGDIDSTTSAGWVGTWYNVGSASGCFNQNTIVDGVEGLVSENDGNDRDALISPNGGEVWSSGETQTIQWMTQYIIGNTVDLYVLHDDPSGLFDKTSLTLGNVVNTKTWYKFATNVQNSGSYVFNPADMSGTGDAYMVLVVSTTDNTKWDISDGTFSLNFISQP